MTTSPRLAQNARPLYPARHYFGSLTATLARMLRDESWMSEAACRDKDPELFMTERPSDESRNRRVEQAKLICATCPVRRQCLEFCFRFPHSGQEMIYGGVTDRERRRYKGKPDRIDRLLALHASQMWRRLSPDWLAGDIPEDIERARQYGFRI